MTLPQLTPAGRPVALGAPVVFLAGTAANYRELVVVGLLGCAAVAVAVLATLPRPDLRVARTVTPHQVMRGDGARAELRLSTPAGRSRLPRLAHGLVLRERVADQMVERQLPSLGAPGTTIRVGYDLPTHRRGLVPVGPVGVVRSDPLRFCRTELAVGAVTELRVQPRVHPLSPLSSGRKRDLDGPAHERASGSVTFHALREYVVGDDLRLVHWPSTARSGTLVVREQVDPSQPLSTVVLDTRAASYATADCFEAAVDAAASVVAASTACRFPVRLVTPSGLSIDGGPGRASGPALLDVLTRVEWSSGDLAGLTRRMAGDRGGVSLVVVTGSDGRDGAQRLATVASRRYENLAVVCFAPAAAPSVVRNGEVLEFLAPGGEDFAALWREVA